MKCRTCHSICADVDSRCPTCGAVLRSAVVASSPIPKIFLLVGAALGVFFGPVVLGVSRTSAGRSYETKKLLASGAGCMVCGTIFFVLGSFLAPRREDD